MSDPEDFWNSIDDVVDEAEAQFAKATPPPGAPDVEMNQGLTQEEAAAIAEQLTPEQFEEARKRIVDKMLEGHGGVTRVRTSLLYIDEPNPRLQEFTCQQGHFMGAVSPHADLTVFREGKVARCIVCGEKRDIPEYVPVEGDEHAEGQ